MIPPQKCCAGIGRPPEELGTISFVLQSFTEQEKEEVCARLNYNICMHANLLDQYSYNVFYEANHDIIKSGPESKPCKLLYCKRSIVNSSHRFLQLQVVFQRGLQAVRIMLQEGFNKSAQFVNTPPQPPEMLNR